MPNSTPYPPQPSGQQSELTDEVLEIAVDFSNERTLSTIAEICYWINDNFTYGIEANFGRHISDILKTRKTSGCHDYGVLFAALARAKGFVVNYMQTFNVEEIRSYQQNPQNTRSASGHVFCEIWLDGHWILVDPGGACYYKDYDPNNKYFPRAKVLYKKGLDSQDIGIVTGLDMDRATKEVVEKVDLSDYSEPKYEKVPFVRKSGKAGVLETETVGSESEPPDNETLRKYFSDMGLGRLPEGGKMPSDLQKDATFFAPGDNLMLYGTVIQEVQVSARYYSIATKQVVGITGPPVPLKLGGFGSGSALNLPPGEYEYKSMLAMCL
jgi:hypothetical protein